MANASNAVRSKCIHITSTGKDCGHMNLYVPSAEEKYAEETTLLNVSGLDRPCGNTYNPYWIKHCGHARLALGEPISNLIRLLAALFSLSESLPCRAGLLQTRDLRERDRGHVQIRGVRYEGRILCVFMWQLSDCLSGKDGGRARLEVNVILNNKPTGVNWI